MCCNTTLLILKAVNSAINQDKTEICVDIGSSNIYLTLQIRTLKPVV